MKVIDLLNKIANGEEAPEKVKYCGEVYDYINIYKEGIRYTNLEREQNDDYRMLIFSANKLNDEVEILDQDYTEEKPLTREGIEAVGYACAEIKKSFKTGWNKSLINELLEEDKKIEYIGKSYDLTTFSMEYVDAALMLRDIGYKQKELIDEVNKLKHDRK